MLKKVSKIAALFCLLAFAGSSFAQTEVPEYPQYGFWSNWGIGITGSFNFQSDVKAMYGNDGYAWGSGFNAGLGIVLQKEVDRGMYVRLRYSYPSFGNCDSNYAKLDPAENGSPIISNQIGMDKRSALTAEYVLSLNNSFHNWNPERRGNLYIFAGGGLAFSHRIKDITVVDANGETTDVPVRGMYDNHKCGLMLNGGLGFSYKVCDWASLFIEAEADGISYSHLFSENWKYHTDFLCNLGLVFDLGVTSADKELIAQRALLTKERFDALNEENDQLKKEVAEEKANEKKLQGQIDELNNENNRIKRECLARAQRVSDSLNGILDNLKNDQLTYYAMPFSVLFDNDSYTVKGSEMTKIKAICQILKDNPDVNLTLAGFCDHTGSDAYNMKLSQKRAEAVKKIMVKKYGIDADRLTIDAKGKTVSFGDLKYDINRRVSFYRVIE